MPSIFLVVPMLRGRQTEFVTSEIFFIEVKECHRKRQGHVIEISGFQEDLFHFFSSVKVQHLFDIIYVATHKNTGNNLSSVFLVIELSFICISKESL